MLMNYPKNVNIRFRFLEVDNETDRTDIYLTPTNPSGIDQTSIQMTHIEGGIYQTIYTPNNNGQWTFRVTCSGKSENNDFLSVYVGAITNDNRFKVECVQASGEKFDFVLVDDEGDRANITSNGRLLVSTEPPSPPDNTTGVSNTEYSNIIGSNDNIYVIPNGEILTLQRFSAGAEEHNNSGSAVELWYDPNGNGSDMTIIDVIFCNGVSDQHDLNQKYEGNGIKTIRMRRKRLGGGSRWIFGRWEGYY